ncbi:pyrimidine 5'-nucleotidase-domain-containing protein [Chytriomyces sp. MP71]|nr:pyrimidine 5'-nucleotidase-domain-containing protein [Chytriomyces sp. MP71]
MCVIMSCVPELISLKCNTRSATPMDALNHTFILIRDRAAVTDKLQRIKADGIDKLHLISDFDMTMTRFWLNGVRSPSTHAVLTRSSRVTEDFKKQAETSYKKYYPLEISTTLSYGEKYAAMEEWWRIAHNLIVDLKLKRSDIASIVPETPVAFREGIHQVIGSCDGLNIPFLVFSAGIYDVIKEILSQASLKTPNVHIVSNRMKFDETDMCVAFEEPMIHTFNKNESGIHGAPYQAAIEERPNVILMGDSLGDLKMKDGVKHDVSLSIGFLNHDTDTWLKEYMDSFDIVVLDDSPMTFVVDLLNSFK